MFFSLCHPKHHLTVNLRHEHIYGNISKNIILSTQFKTARRDNSLQGIPVILCTLSMLANPRLDIFTTLNPIKTLVIDEASQIAIGDYISPLLNFPTITKICMIGDHKQCRLFAISTTVLLLNISYCQCLLMVLMEMAPSRVSLKSLTSRIQQYFSASSVSTSVLSWLLLNLQNLSRSYATSYWRGCLRCHV